MKESLEKMEKFVGEGKEDEKPLKRVFVEVGTRYIPVPFMGEKNISDDELYIGVDIEKDVVKQAKKNTELLREEKNTKRMLFLQADARRLPLADEISDEVFFGNVLGDPHISDNNKKKFLSEAARIVKKEGVIIIKETNTPLAHDELSALLKHSGLEVIREVRSGASDWPNEISLYEKARKKNSQIHAWGSYLIYVKEKKE